MLKHLIIDIYPIALAIILAIFLLVKVRAMQTSRVRSRNRREAFMRSLLPVSKQIIKNMTNNRLREYYRKSNDINLLFLIVIAAMSTVYVLMVSIK